MALVSLVRSRARIGRLGPVCLQRQARLAPLSTEAARSRRGGMLEWHEEAKTRKQRNRAKKSRGPRDGELRWSEPTAKRRGTTPSFNLEWLERARQNIEIERVKQEHNGKVKRKGILDKLIGPDGQPMNLPEGGRLFSPGGEEIDLPPVWEGESSRFQKMERVSEDEKLFFPEPLENRPALSKAERLNLAAQITEPDDVGPNPVNPFYKPSPEEEGHRVAEKEAAAHARRAQKSSNISFTGKRRVALPEIKAGDFQVGVPFNINYDKLTPEMWSTPSERGQWVWTLPYHGDPQIPTQSFVWECREAFSAGADFLGSGLRAKQIAFFNDDSAQVAFLGRSNVGKSSLINALFGTGAKQQRAHRKRAGARVSKTPGRTRYLNMFGMGRRDDWKHRPSLPHFRLTLVDCPGYGFAALNNQGTAQMSKSIANYLENLNRSIFSRAYVLIDGRHGVMENDACMMQMLNYLEVPFQVILTKLDKINDKSLAETALCVQRHIIDSNYMHCANQVLGVTVKSDKAGMSVNRLRAEILMHSDVNVYRRLKTTKRVVH